jgi:hypothetical protein
MLCSNVSPSPFVAGSSPNIFTPSPLPSVNSSCPLHFVYIEGVPQARDSISGKFHPSARAQDIST